MPVVSKLFAIFILLPLGIQATQAACSLDIDKNGQQDALTDGLLIMRHLSGLSGNSLTQNALGANAQRGSAGDITDYLNSVACQQFLDIDANQSIEAATDGLLTLRYLFGFTGTSLTEGAVGNSASRQTPAEITQWYINNALPVFDNKLTIDDTVGETHAVVAADFDNDNDMDLAATDFTASKVYWYENTGANQFTRQTVDNNLGAAYPLSIGDVNGDGNMDLLATGYRSGTVAWYKNNGQGSFSKQVVSQTNNTGPHSAVAQDINQDGDMDILVTTQEPGTVEWYENNGSNQFTKHSIDTEAFGGKYAVAADLDNDNDMDVVAVSFFMPTGEQVKWYENDGSENFTEHTIASITNGAYYVSTSDVDADNDQDIVIAVSFDDVPPNLNPRPVVENDNSIILYRNEGLNNGVLQFAKQVIDDSAHGARSVIAADIDNDGADDLVAGIREDNTVAWYRNDGQGGFSKHTIDTTVGGAYGVFAADINGDGKLDVLSSGRVDDTVNIHYQQ